MVDGSSNARPAQDLTEVRARGNRTHAAGGTLKRSLYASGEAARAIDLSAASGIIFESNGRFGRR